MMEDTKKQYALFWIYSTVLSLIFVSIIGWTWYQVDSRYQPNNSQLINIASKGKVIKLNEGEYFP